MTGSNTPEPSPSPSLVVDAFVSSYVYPPDTTGAVGHTRILTASNSLVSIHDKGGTSLEQWDLDEFCQQIDSRVGDPFDPRVVYDPESGRFIIAVLDREFNGAESRLILCHCLDGEIEDLANWNGHVLEGVGAASGRFLDFPQIGFSADKVAISLRLFADKAALLADQGGELDGSICVVDKASLFETSPVVQWFDMDEGNWTISCTYDPGQPDLFLGVAALPSNHPDKMRDGLYFLRITGTVGTDLTGPEVIYSLVWRDGVTWRDASHENILPQRGTDTRIRYCSSDNQMLVFRNGCLWYSHSIMLDTDDEETALQFWQVEVTDPETLTLVQVAKITDPELQLAYPSLAVNTAGDVLIGFSVFSPDMHPSCGYVFRYANDPLESFRAPQIYKEGSDYWSREDEYGRVRWGDYSATAIDPADPMSMWTVQEYAFDRGDSGPDPDKGRQPFWGICWAKVTGFDPG